MEYKMLNGTWNVTDSNYRGRLVIDNDKVCEINHHGRLERQSKRKISNDKLLLKDDDGGTLELTYAVNDDRLSLMMGDDVRTFIRVS